MHGTVTAASRFRRRGKGSAGIVNGTTSAGVAAQQRMRNLSSGRAAALLFTLFALSACGARARFEIVRPALLDASPFGNSFSVQPFQGVDVNAAYRAQALLEQRITASLNPSHRLMMGGGGVIIGGQVLTHDYREEMRQQDQTCSRSVNYVDANGRTQSRSESYRCTQYTRYGTARSAIRFTVAIANTGQIVWDRVYDDARDAQTSATNQTPDGINAGGMLDAMVQNAVSEFSTVILPWPDTVEVAFSDCGGGEGCDDAWGLVRSGDLAGAEVIYTRILGPYDDVSAAVNPEDNEIVADTLFNRGVVRAYTGSYELGMADIQRAVSLRPEEDSWAPELARIEALAGEQDALRQQIEGAAPPQPGQTYQQQPM